MEDIIHLLHQMKRIGLPLASVYASVLNECTRRRETEWAEQLFQEMRENIEDGPTTIHYNIFIHGYERERRREKGRKRERDRVEMSHFSKKTDYACMRTTLTSTLRLLTVVAQLFPSSTPTSFYLLFLFFFLSSFCELPTISVKEGLR
jgi:pentatricopeptide repeat protein